MRIDRINSRLADRSTGEEEKRRPWNSTPSQPGAHVEARKFHFVFFARNPLKSPVSTKQIQA
jgi:hypothetical protein